MQAVLGIDLGTSKICAGLVHDSKYSIVETPDGRQLINYVTFKDILKFGDFSKKNIRTGWNNTLYDSKVLLQNSLDDEFFKDNLARWPFKINQQTIKVELKELETENAMSMFIARIKELTDQKFQTKISRAVITCPASFNNSDRRSVIKSANLAGLEVVRLLNDTTSACIDIAHKSKAENTFMVFNLGAYYLNLCICEVKNGHVKMIVAESFAHLGGEIMDLKLANHICQKLKIQKTKKLFQALLIECEKAKICLSDSNQVDIQLESILENGKDLECSITRDEFNSINKNLFASCLDKVKDLFKEAKLESIGEVFFIGGCSRISELKTKVSQYFNKSVNLTLNASESVTHGAVILAGFLSGEKLVTSNGSFYEEISSNFYELKVYLEQEEFIRLVIPKYSKLPVEKDVFFVKKQNDKFELEIFENNKLIWKSKLHSIFQLKLSLDLNGVISLSSKYIDSENIENEELFLKLDQSIKNEQNAFKQKDIDEIDAITKELNKRIKNLISFFSGVKHKDFFKKEIEDLELLLDNSNEKVEKRIGKITQKLMDYDSLKNNVAQILKLKEKWDKWYKISTSDKLDQLIPLLKLSNTVEYQEIILRQQNQFKIFLLGELKNVLHYFYKYQKINCDCYKSIIDEIEMQKYGFDLKIFKQTVENHYKSNHFIKDIYDCILDYINLLD